jgi:hypothetical protein
VGCSPDPLVRGPLRLFETLSDIKEAADQDVKGGFVGVLSGSLVTPALFETLIKAGMSGALVLHGPVAGGWSPEGTGIIAPSPLDPNPDAGPAWNPQGNGMLYKKWRIPITLLGPRSSAAVRAQAAENKENKREYPRYSAELQFFMQASGTTSRCLKKGRCRVLGGASPFMTIPATLSSTRELVMATATIDSTGLFRDAVVGANAHLSGAVCLALAARAIDSLLDQARNATLGRDMAFMFFNGEAFNSMGSSRFAADLGQPCGSANLTGGYCKEPWMPNLQYTNMSYSRIAALVNLGQVGYAGANNDTGDPASSGKLYAHITAKAGSIELQRVLQDAGDSVGVRIAGVEKGVTLTPSPLVPLLARNLSIPAVDLQDFDSSFTGRYYHSHLDTPDLVNVSRLCDVATATARALYELARPSAGAPPSSSLAVNCTELAEVFRCLTTDISCQLGVKLLNLKQTDSDLIGTPTHYVGVYDPWNMGPYAKFWFQYLGLGSNLSTVYIHTALPKAVKINYSTDEYTIDEDDKEAQVWAESSWDVTGLRIYKEGSPLAETVLAVLGVFITAATYGLAVLLKRHYTSHRPFE